MRKAFVPSLFLCTRKSRGLPLFGQLLIGECLDLYTADHVACLEADLVAFFSVVQVDERNARGSLVDPEDDGSMMALKSAGLEAKVAVQMDQSSLVGSARLSRGRTFSATPDIPTLVGMLGYE